MVWEELRTAIRYPLHLPVLLMVDGREIEAVTVNVSQNGVLLRVGEALPLAARLEFLLPVPPEVFSHDATAAIHCTGLVTRSYQEDGSVFVAAIIEEYQFQ